MDSPRMTPLLRRLVLRAPNGLPARAVAALNGRDCNTLPAGPGERSGHKSGVELSVRAGHAVVLALLASVPHSEKRKVAA